MNTLSMNADTTLALAERAARLEHFELAIAKHAQAEAEAEAEALREQLREKERSYVEEFSRLKYQTSNPIQAAIDILQSHQQHIDKLTQAEHQRDLFDRENNELHAQVVELTGAGEKLHEQVIHYKDQCDKLLDKNNIEVQKAQAEIDRQGRQLALYAQEVKDLRALNPQRLAKQVKELQKKNKGLGEGNQQLRKLANDNQKIRKEHEERGRVIVKLHDDNRRLDAALMEACDQLNNESKVQPIEEHGDWAIYAHNDGTEALIIHHGPTDSSRVYWAGEGCRKSPAIPPKLKARAEAMIENYRNTKAGMIDYAGGGRVEVV
jgi:chromosome segregation ATPase